MKQLHQSLTGWIAPKGSETRLIFTCRQVVLFGYLQAVSCIFPAFIFISLALSSSLTGLGIARYDVLLLICILVQIVMYTTGLETRDELYVITFFHLLGLLMELHKVYHGSWSYPEEAYTKIWNVPLYSGFMYASVGSYICQAWRNLQLRTIHWPINKIAIIIALVIYLNFITNAFIYDLRIFIALALLLVFWKTKFSFVLGHRQYNISAIGSFILIGLFIWFAENIATFFGAWKYAYQHNGWQMVEWHKITSWSLLVIVSIIIVAQLKRFKSQAIHGSE